MYALLPIQICPWKTCLHIQIERNADIHLKAIIWGLVIYLEAWLHMPICPWMIDSAKFMESKHSSVSKLIRRSLFLSHPINTTPARSVHRGGGSCGGNRTDHTATSVPHDKSHRRTLKYASATRYKYFPVQKWFHFGYIMMEDCSDKASDISLSCFKKQKFKGRFFYFRYSGKSTKKTLKTRPVGGGKNEWQKRKRTWTQILCTPLWPPPYPSSLRIYFVYVYRSYIRPIYVT